MANTSADTDATGDYKESKKSLTSQ